MKLLDRNITNKIGDMISDIVSTCSRILSTEAKVDEAASYDSKEDAKNRLKLVLMHDRSQLTPNQVEQMKEELIDVISRYVEIDKDALDLCLEAETNTIALVANIPVLRTRKEEEQLQNQIEAVMSEGQTEGQEQAACDCGCQESSESQEQEPQQCDCECQEARQQEQQEPQCDCSNYEVTDEEIQCGCECETEKPVEGCSCDCSSEKAKAE